jgi:uncharacterized protein YegJ (DUF2314 family)
VGVVPLALAAAGLRLARHPWARKVELGTVAAAWVAIVVKDLAEGTLGWSLIWKTALPAAWAYVVWTSDDEDERPSAESNDEPFLSLVLLLREPAYLDTTILSSLATRAWGIPVPVGGEGTDETPAPEAAEKSGEPTFVVGEPPLFVIRHPDAYCLVHCHAATYFDDPEAVAEDLIELRTRQVILEHRAWVAVDVLHWEGPDDPLLGAYRLIARLLAELADDNVLAVLDPDAGQIFPYDPELEQRLRSADPLATLREGLFAPVIGVEDDDPRMLAAVEEARRRWPEFVAAFEQRDPDAPGSFAIKARFAEGDRAEYMWVAVTGLEHDFILGTLSNAPVNLQRLQEGDRVRVPLDDLNDWLYVADGELVGAFTAKVLDAVAKEAHQRREQPPPT